MLTDVAGSPQPPFTAAGMVSPTGTGTLGLDMQDVAGVSGGDNTSQPNFSVASSQASSAAQGMKPAEPQRTSLDNLKREINMVSQKVSQAGSTLVGAGM